MLHRLCELLWRRDYPQGGSRYQTYDSLPLEDKEFYTKEAHLLLNTEISQVIYNAVHECIAIATIGFGLPFEGDRKYDIRFHTQGMSLSLLTYNTSEVADTARKHLVNEIAAALRKKIEEAPL